MRYAIALLRKEYEEKRRKLIEKGMEDQVKSFEEDMERNRGDKDARTQIEDLLKGITKLKKEDSLFELLPIDHVGIDANIPLGCDIEQVLNTLGTCEVWDVRYPPVFPDQPYYKRTVSIPSQIPDGIKVRKVEQIRYVCGKRRVVEVWFVNEEVDHLIVSEYDNSDRTTWPWTTLVDKSRAREGTV